jgi:hypothetical protein
MPIVVERQRIDPRRVEQVDGDDCEQVRLDCETEPAAGDELFDRQRRKQLAVDERRHVLRDTNEGKEGGGGGEWADKDGFRSTFTIKARYSSH